MPDLDLCGLDFEGIVNAGPENKKDGIRTLQLTTD